VVQLNKPISTGKDNSGEIYYQNDGVQCAVQRDSLRPEIPNTPLSHAHTKEIK
jgi:hypothetical protein